MVHPLAQQFNGRLRAVGLQQGHVEVVDEEDEVLAFGRRKHTFAPNAQASEGGFAAKRTRERLLDEEGLPFVQLAVDEILSLVGRGAR